MSTARPLTRRHVTFRGRVQGVGFRWTVRLLAEELKVAGWVRNREDGAVEAEAEGTREAVDAFVERLKTENPAARVDDLEQSEMAAQGSTSFEIRR